MTDEQARLVKKSQDLMSELVWRAPDEELAEMADQATESPQRFIHLINKELQIVCSGQPIVSMAPSTLAGNIQVGASRFGKDPEMLFITSRARRSSCARCIYIFNEDMKYARGEIGEACMGLFRVMGILGGFGGVVALVVLAILWLT